MQTKCLYKAPYFIFTKATYYSMVDRIMAPQRSPCPNPQNLYIHYLNSIRDFVDVIKLRIVSWRDVIIRIIVMEKVRQE